MEELKQELIDKIRNTQNEDLLLLVKEDIVFSEIMSKDDRLGLSEEDYNELKELAEEEEGKDTISFDDFKKSMQQWRTHS